jgi:Anti sigma-E protein RseA, N-terminal domain
MSEQISRWLDGDLAQNEGAAAFKPITSTGNNSANSGATNVRESVAMYALIGEVMRGNQTAATSVALGRSRSIFEALDKEPTVFAPSSANDVAKVVRGQVELELNESQEQSRELQEQAGFVDKLVANGAPITVSASAAAGTIGSTTRKASRLNLAVIAFASVATIGAIAWLGMSSQSVQPGAAPAVLAQTPGQAGQTTLVADTSTPTSQPAAVQRTMVQSPVVMQAQWGEYLVAHRQSANTAAIMPATRNVVVQCSGKEC